VFVAGVTGLAYVVRGEAVAVVERLPAGARTLREKIRGPSTANPGALAKVDEAAKELKKDDQPIGRDVVRVQVEDHPFKIGDYLWSGSMNAVSFANQMVMLLFLTYFMLVADDLFKR
jgi:hypothetical protein